MLFKNPNRNIVYVCIYVLHNYICLTCTDVQKHSFEQKGVKQIDFNLRVVLKKYENSLHSSDYCLFGSDIPERNNAIPNLISFLEFASCSFWVWRLRPKKIQY